MVLLASGTLQAWSMQTLHLRIATNCYSPDKKRVVPEGTAILLYSTYSRRLPEVFSPSISMRRLQWLLFFGLQRLVSITGASSRPSILRTLRGGDERMYELNPNYTPHASHRTQTFAELEESYSRKAYEMRNSFETSFYPRSSSSSLSLPELIKQYLTNLFKLSPEIFTLVVSCASVFVGWQLDACRRFLQRNFVLSNANLRDGRFWCIYTSALSHSSALHLLLNTSALLSLGPRVAGIVNLRLLFLGSTLASSLGFLILGGKQRMGGAMGLSGFTMSLLAVYAKLFPRDILGTYIFGVFPVRVPASRMLELMVLWSVLGTLMTMASSQQIAHSAHLGGLLFGVLYHKLWKNHQRQKSIF